MFPLWGGTGVSHTIRGALSFLLITFTSIYKLNLGIIYLHLKSSWYQYHGIISDSSSEYNELVVLNQ